MKTALRRTASPPTELVAAYKTLLSRILERRPSGTRQRLAMALAKNRSFVSQITNPAYATPIPANHIDVIFDTCHFSAGERQQFLAAYALAHPKFRTGRQAATHARMRSIPLPDLGDNGRNRQLETLVRGLVDQIVALLQDAGQKGKRR